VRAADAIKQFSDVSADDAHRLAGSFFALDVDVPGAAAFHIRI
jgi:hypothetical protein